MRLNPDCIRDILFYIEDTTDYQIWTFFLRSSKDFDIQLKNNYSPNEILYHLELCEEYGYIVTPDKQPMRESQVKRLSVSGHEFLENIRQDTNWNKTKEVAEGAGSTSIKIISNIASNLAVAYISKHLGL